MWLNYYTTKLGIMMDSMLVSALTTCEIIFILIVIISIGVKHVSAIGKTNLVIDK